MFSAYKREQQFSLRGIPFGAIHRKTRSTPHSPDERYVGGVTSGGYRYQRWKETKTTFSESFRASLYDCAIHLLALSNQFLFRAETGVSPPSFYQLIRHLLVDVSALRLTVRPNLKGFGARPDTKSYLSFDGKKEHRVITIQMVPDTCGMFFYVCSCAWNILSIPHYIISLDLSNPTNKRHRRWLYSGRFSAGMVFFFLFLA